MLPRVRRQDPEGHLLVEPKRALTLVDIRAALAAAGAPAPSRAFTVEEMDAAIGQALESRHGRPCPPSGFPFPCAPTYGTRSGSMAGSRGSPGIAKRSSSPAGSGSAG